MSSTFARTLARPLAVVLVVAVLAAHVGPGIHVVASDRPTVALRGPDLESNGTFVPASASVPAAGSDGFAIDSCREIDSPGRYHLVADLVSSTYACLEITADDVVVDGGGHALTVAESARAFGEAIAMPSPDQFGEAVVISDGRSNVTVANLSFEGFDVGIRSAGGTDLTVTGVTGTNTVTAVFLDGTAGARIESATIERSATDGLIVRNATDVSIADTSVETSWFAGIVVDGSDRVRIDATTVERNHGDGLYVHDSTNVTVTRLIGAENAVGVLAVAAAGTTVTESTLDRNSIAGVAVVAADLTVADSTISNTVGDPGVVAVEYTAGLLAVGAPDATLRDVTVFGNHDWTIAATDGASVSVERVTAGSAVVSFTATDVTIDLDSIVDDPCTAETTTAMVAAIDSRATVTDSDGTLADATVTCAR